MSLDADIMGTDDQVSLTFENATVDGARKVLQKIVLLLFTPTVSNFYSNLKRASASDPERLGGLLNTALATVKSHVTANRDADDPGLVSLTGEVESITGDLATAIVSVELSDGSTASTSVQLGESNE